MTIFLKRYPATSFLVGVTIFIFLGIQVVFFGNATSNLAVFLSGGMYGDYVVAHPEQLWRLVSPIFVHIGWEHFIFNTLTIYFLGQMAEQIWGSWRFLLLYLLAGVMGNVFTFFLTPSVIAAGASTSLFGLFAAVICLGRLSSHPYLKNMAQSYQALVIFNLVFNLVMPNVGIAGHIGGLVGGALATLFFGNAIGQHIIARGYRLLALLVYALLLVLPLVLRVMLR